MFPPFLDQDLSFTQVIEYVSIEKLVSHPTIEAITLSLLTWVSRFDVDRLSADGCNPVPDSLSDQFKAVTRLDA